MKPRFRPWFTGAFVVALAMGLVRLAAGRSTGDAPFRTSLGGVDGPVPDSGWVLHDSVLSVDEAVELDGTWVLLDRMGRIIHLLGPDGLLAGSFGGPGQGPGELSSPAALAAVGDSIWVADFTGTRLDLFTRDGRFVRRRQLSPPCSVPTLDDMAAGPRGLVVALRCVGFTGSIRHVLRIPPDGSQAQSIPLPPGENKRLVGDRTMLVGTPETVFVGSAFRPCLYDTGGDPLEPQICLARAQRTRIPPGVLEELAPEGRVRRILALTRETSGFYPYLLRVSHTASGLIAAQPESEDQLVLTPMGNASSAAEGVVPEPVGQALRAPEGARAFVGDSLILLVSPAMEGTRITFVAFPDSWRTPQPTGAKAGPS